MRISLVTASLNQGRFLGSCIESILGQDHDDIEHIVVDPGSSDVSREVIAFYGNQIVTILEPDEGPPDGLNKGFAQATGDVFGYLNADDMLLPGALRFVADHFTRHPNVDVVCGHALVVDAESEVVRRVFSDRFSLRAVAYGACVTIQPSTFFRRGVFERVGGFNVRNRSNWDGELLVDMALAGARIARADRVLSCYRVHGESITGSGRLAAAHKEYSQGMFEKIMGRPQRTTDGAMKVWYRLAKHTLNPKAALERMRFGPVFGSQS